MPTTTSNTESYRNITGPRAQLAVAKSDGRLFHRGHLFGKGSVAGEAVTIGYSSASKVWSNTNGQLADLIAWCQSLARNLQSEAPIPTHEGISFLTVGEPLDQFPATIIAAEWDADTYRKQPILHHGAERTPLTDVELTVQEHTPEQVRLQLQGPNLTYDVSCTLTGQRYFDSVNDSDDELTIEQGRDTLGLIDYLNANPITLYTSEFASIRGAEIFRTDEGLAPFDRTKITPIDWTGVNIQREFWQDNQEHNERSIHEHLLHHLSATTTGLIMYDHRTGEIADLITMETHDNKPCLTFYHVKRSTAAQPGQRVRDVYEVAGQIIKSVAYINDLDGLRRKIERRLATGSHLSRGNQHELMTFFTQARQRGCTFRLTLVQPGLTEDLSEPNMHVLAAADDYARRAGAETLTVITTGQPAQQAQHG